MPDFDPQAYLKENEEELFDPKAYAGIEEEGPPIWDFPGFEFPGSELVGKAARGATAGVASMFSEKPAGQIYEEMTEAERARGEAYEKAHPIASKFKYAGYAAVPPLGATIPGRIGGAAALGALEEGSRGEGFFDPKKAAAGMLGAGGIQGGIEAISPLAGKVAKALPGKEKITDWLRQRASERAIKGAMGHGQKATESLQRWPGTTEAGQRLLKEPGLIKPFQKIGEVQPKLYSAVENYGNQIGKVGEVLDAAAPNAVDGRKIAEKLRREAEEIFMDIPQFQNRKQAIMEFADLMERKGQISFAEAQKYKNAFKFTEPKFMQSDPARYVDENLQKLAVSDAMESAVDRVGPRALDDLEAALKDPAIRSRLPQQLVENASRDLPEAKAFLNSYPELKRQYGTLKKVLQQSVKQTAGEVSRRAVSPSDYGFGIGGALLGGVAGQGLPEAAILGGAASLGHRALRGRGSTAAARGLQAVADTLEKNPQAFGRFAGALQDAARRGIPSLLLTHNLLMKMPEYQQTIEKIMPEGELPGMGKLKGGIEEALQENVVNPLTQKGYGKTGAALGTAGATLADISLPDYPIEMIPGMVMATKGGKLLKIADYLAKKRGEKAAGSLGKINKMMEELKGFKTIDKIPEFADIADDTIVSENIQKLLNRFDEPPKKYLQALKGGSYEPYVGRDISNPVYIQSSSKKMMEQIPQMPMIPARVTPKIEDGFVIIGSDLQKGGADPFAWLDHKYGGSKELLRTTETPVKINTRSDLIGHDDYRWQIPYGSEVNFYIFSDNPRAQRVAVPGGSSLKRLIQAANRLKEQKIKVNFVLDKIVSKEPLIQAKLNKFNTINEIELKRMGFGVKYNPIEATDETIEDLAKLGLIEDFKP